ncbi:DUF262 domain-containing protein [Devosia sp.]|uniref:DUF262 domain-containing protein n=1 Tax=Devosia sp. TaxID=1871048 RepID=UPI002FC6762A
MAGVVKHSYTPEKRSIGDLLSMTSPAIVVPDWQRNYSWRTEHVETLWNDVVRFSDRSGETLTDEYFFGSVVLVTAANQRLLLLDGQQRLATSTILMSAIRDTMAAIDKKTADFIQANWLSGFDAIRQEEIQKIRLNIYDRDFFKRLVSDPRDEGYSEPAPQYASHNLIASARSFFLNSIAVRTEGMDQKAASAWLRRIVAILTDHFTVIAAFSDNEDNAAEVFETLNDRGIGLSTPDLLRNLVIRRAPTNQQDEVVSRWEDVIAFETDTEIKSFLRHYWVSKHGDVKSQSLYREVKSVIEQDDIDSMSLSAELSDAAKLYRNIRSSSGDTELASDLLSQLNSIGPGAAILYPPILSVFATFSPEQVETALRSLLNVYTRDGIIGQIENSILENRFYKAARSLRVHKSLATFCLDVAEGALADDEVRIRFNRLILTQNGPRRHLLYCIEMAKRQTGEVQINPPSKVHVEHIYPQKPEAGQRWATHDRHINRIGNLSLLDKRINAGIRNGGFAAKKPHYAKSEIIMTQELTELEDWTADSIAVRQDAFAVLAPTVWPIVLV